MLEKIKETADFIWNKTNFNPEIGIILGTGLGGLVEEINVLHSLDYKDITNFPLSTVEGHSGKLILGELSGKKDSSNAGALSFLRRVFYRKSYFPCKGNASIRY